MNQKDLTNNSFSFAYNVHIFGYRISKQYILHYLSEYHYFERELKCDGKIEDKVQTLKTEEGVLQKEWSEVE